MTHHAEEIKKPLVRKLLTWYGKNKRDLPWRETNDPYCIWVSEIMLQQTQVDTVVPYYLRFLKAFPDIGTLADAPQADVLKAWENLGYYSRARHLHAAARLVMDRFGGRVPDNLADLRKLPGIGAYTAGAIASIAWDVAVPAVDGNVRRILCRFFAVHKRMDDRNTMKYLEKIAEALIPVRSPGVFNSALMDLGATICRPKNPRCEVCPVKTLCRAKALNLEHDLPIVKKRKKIPHRLAAAAVIRDRRGRLLMVQRPACGLLASLWKLPGGFLDGPSNMQEGLSRQVKAELGMDIRVGVALASVDHTYTHFRLTLNACACDWVRGKPEAVGCPDWQWVTPDDIGGLAVSKVDRMILEALPPV
jgi:A/G-specific adenine glycosylase